jgi:flagellar biosynthesis/type III secretory pathway protein FliH
MQKEAEIAAALETGRKEGYHLGHQEGLEAVRKVQVVVTETDTLHCDVVTRPVAVLPSMPVVHAPHT